MTREEAVNLLESLRIVAGEFGVLSGRRIEAIGMAIDALGSTPAGPTLGDCLVALNRNEHRGWSRWECSAVAGVNERLNEVEIRAIGAYYIGRDRAGTAKGE